MEDREFFDKLMQMFSKTSFAENRYWDYGFNTDDGDTFDIGAVDSDGKRQYVGAFLSEADADFITALHGCFPDLYRRLHAALDEADRADADRDARECRIAELELEVQSMRKELLTA